MKLIKRGIKLNKYGLIHIEDDELLATIVGASKESCQEEGNSHNGYCGHDLSCGDTGCPSQ